MPSILGFSQCKFIVQFLEAKRATAYWILIKIVIAKNSQCFNCVNLCRRKIQIMISIKRLLLMLS